MNLVTALGGCCLAAASLVDVGADCCGAAARAAPFSAVARADTVSLKTVELDVEGMYCGGCAISTRAALTRLSGVRRADVSMDTRKARVTYEPARVTVEQMISAIRKIGFTASVVSKPRGAGG